MTLHPFDDGNGRITRLLTDLALAEAESQSIHLYAMPVTILANRQNYYKILEQSQKGKLDITPWLMWFLNSLGETFINVLEDIDRTICKTSFWTKVDQIQLHSEQVKVLSRMLEGDFDQGINTSQYHNVAKVSKATASRHLSLLVKLGCLVKSEAGGRSTRYKLAHLQE